jgi:hypothetical protein
MGAIDRITFILPITGDIFLLIERTLGVGDGDQTVIHSEGDRQWRP